MPTPHNIAGHKTSCFRPRGACPFPPSDCRDLIAKADCTRKSISNLYSKGLSQNDDPKSQESSPVSFGCCNLVHFFKHDISRSFVSGIKHQDDETHYLLARSKALHADENHLRHFIHDVWLRRRGSGRRPAAPAVPRRDWEPKGRVHYPHDIQLLQLGGLRNSPHRWHLCVQDW